MMVTYGIRRKDRPAIGRLGSHTIPHCSPRCGACHLEALGVQAADPPLRTEWMCFDRQGRVPEIVKTPG
jgi:hypothetical protein